MGSPQPKFDLSLWPWPLSYTSGPGNMCIKFQINRSTIDDFRNSEKKSTFFDVTWQKNVTSYVDGGSVFPKRLSTENILQPTRSLYDVWSKRYGSLCVFHVWGDLDLDLRPFKVIIFVWGQHRPISVHTKYWTFSVAEFLWYDCTLKNQCTIRVTLTYDLWRSIIFLWIDYQPMSILYKFEINISTNIREIKYLNIEIWV